MAKTDWIAGFDPGKATGWAVLHRETGTASGVFLYDHGEEVGDLRLQAVAGLCNMFAEMDRVISLIVQAHGVPTDHLGVEVQGVLKCAGAIPYYPATIHSQLGTHNKAETRTFVRRALGNQVVGIKSDHVFDAIAVALCHAVKVGNWQLRISAGAIDTPPTAQTRRSGQCGGKGPVTVSEAPTQAELKALLASGKARVGR